MIDSISSIHSDILHTEHRALQEHFISWLVQGIVDGELDDVLLPDIHELAVLDSLVGEFRRDVLPILVQGQVVFGNVWSLVLEVVVESCLRQRIKVSNSINSLFPSLDLVVVNEHILVLKV